MTAPGMPTREIPAGITAEQAAILASQQAYQAQQEALRQQLAAAVIAIWASVAQFGDFSPTEAAIWVERILPISTGAQRAMVAITVARLNQMHQPPEPIIVLPPVRPPRGRPPAEVYARPFNEIRYRLSQGKTVGQAVRAGQRRALSIATTDLQLAQTTTAQQYMQKADKAPPGPKGRIVGYRRVLSNNPNHCALCMIASTQRYHRAKLMAIHPGCGCTVMPIWGESDPGQTINAPYLLDIHDIVARDLGEKYKASDARSGAAHYRDIIITHEHGELGPVLGVREHDYTGPNDIPRLDKHRRVNPPPEPPEDIIDLDAL